MSYYVSGSNFFSRQVCLLTPDPQLPRLDSGCRISTHVLVRRVVRLVIGTGSLTGKSLTPIHGITTYKHTYYQRPLQLWIKFFIKRFGARATSLHLRSFWQSCTQIPWWSSSTLDLKWNRAVKIRPLTLPHWTWTPLAKVFLVPGFRIRRRQRYLVMWNWPHIPRKDI